MMNSQQGSPGDLVRLLFYGQPVAAHSVQITGDFETTRDMFEALLMCFTEGMKHLHGNADGVVDLPSMKPDQFAEVQQRFAGISITPITYHYHLQQVLALQGGEIPEQTALEMDWISRSSEYPEVELRHLTDYRTQTSTQLEDYYFGFQTGFEYFILQFKINISSGD